jgi:hypothetical protein
MLKAAIGVGGSSEDPTASRYALVFVRRSRSVSERRLGHCDDGSDSRSGDGTLFVIACADEEGSPSGF